MTFTTPVVPGASVSLGGSNTSFTAGAALESVTVSVVLPRLETYTGKVLS